MASSSSAQEIVEYQEVRERSKKLYDAFISHRGPDVKDTLAKQLYKLLQERGCRAFLDREEIEGGDSVPFAISNGICSSVVQIAIFSKRYAESKWCLDELVLMLAQVDSLFIPVFYEVKPWELRHTEKGVYAEAFSDYRRKERYLDKLDEWKNALEFAADISGYELSEHKDNLCEKIVSRVLQEMEKRIPLHVAKYPVGLAELVQDFERSCSKIVRDKVTMVGVFGLGGSGKTTLAKELFNRKRSRYDASCFLSDVREAHASLNLNSLHSQLFKDLFNENRVFRNVDEGIGQLKHRLGRAKHLHFLIVLDDIDHPDQLDALLPEAMLSSGSLVIITTRDQSVLTGADINIRYRMKEMNKDHAKELFCSHAFRVPDSPLAYKKLIENFLEFCGGLPLALKVLGAHVYGRDEYYWELQLEKVKNIQPKDIMQRLKISFDGLDSHEKQIFIDIACLFNKKEIQHIKSIATSIWKGSGWSGEHAVQTLQDKCLVEVTVKNPHFEMHDQLRDLGRQMADDLGPPRLWRPDILRSMEAKGFKQTLAETKGRCLHSFKDSLLKTNISYFVGSSNDSAETELLWLRLFGKLQSMPSWIPVQKLQCLSISNVEELWSTFQKQLQINNQASFQLRMLTIYCSPSLQNLPDLIEKLNQLEELRIIKSLEKTDITSFIQSVKQLSNLRSLQLSEGGGSFSGNLNLSKDRDSTNFEASTSSRMKSLETIKFRRLDNISMLLISGKICPRLQLLEVLAMWNLSEMDLQQLERLNCLIMKHCPKLETISGLSSVTGLRVLYTMDCERLRSLPNLAHLRHLERITIVECYQLQSVQGVEELQGLKSLEIGAHDRGDASVLNCIHGLKRLPSEHIILRGKAVERASSRLNVNLFSDAIGAQAVAEIKTGEDMLEMRSSSTAITMYALLVTSNRACIEVESAVTHLHFLPPEGEWMITVVLTPHDSRGSLKHITIQEGFKATVNKEEEGKALTVLQRIVDQLYGQSMLPNLAAYDVVKRKRKRKY